MFEEINEIKGEIVRLQHQKSELQRDVQRISDKLNRKDQELVNYLKQELNGKCVKVCKEKPSYPCEPLVRYGYVYNVFHIDMAKVAFIDFTGTNKLILRYESRSIEELKFISEEEIKEYIYDLFKDRVVGQMGKQNE